MKKKDRKLFINLLKKSPMLKPEIMEKFGWTSGQFKREIKGLRNSGVRVQYNPENNFYFVTTDADKVAQRYELETCKQGELRTHRFISASDFHMGSKYDHISGLQEIADYAEAEGIERIFVSGDITDGNGKVYRGQMRHMKVIGADNMVNYMAEKLPKKDGIQYFMISGNHDFSFNQEGVDTTAALARERDDVTFLGDYAADIVLDDVVLRLVHLDKASAYAASYPMQTYIRNLNLQDTPVNVLMAGHPHRFCTLEEQGVLCIQNYGMQKQTPYIVRKGIVGQMGFVDVTLQTLDGKIKDVNLKAIRSYE